MEGGSSGSPLNMVKSDSLLYCPDPALYRMLPVSDSVVKSQSGGPDDVYSIVNYSISDEIDEGYNTNYSPSSKSSSSFECDNTFEKQEASPGSEDQVTHKWIFVLFIFSFRFYSELKVRF